MEVPPTQPPEQTRSNQPAQTPKTSQGQIDSKVESPSETPDSGGVLASSQVESGELRDAAAQHETKDRNSLAEAIQRVTSEAGLVGQTRLAIDVDETTNESRFLILSKETGQILRTIPNEDILPVLRELTQHSGALMDRRG
jgi:uncharacterized FlaG/YvyC family protein